MQRASCLSRPARTAWLVAAALSLVANVQAQEQTISLVGQMGGYCQAVHVQGRYAYVGEGWNFTILDIADPTSPVVTARLRLPQMIEDVVVSGGFAYVADGYGGLKIVDVSDPSSPTLRKSFNSTPQAFVGHVHLSGGFVYLSTSRGLQILDVSDPSSPTLRGTCTPAGQSDCVATSGTLVYLTRGSGGFQIVDVSNSSSPTLRCSYRNTAAYGLALAGSFAYVAAGQSFNVVDVTDPWSLYR
jgi:hypothetical protein